MSLEEKDVVFQQIIAHVIADRGKEMAQNKEAKSQQNRLKKPQKQSYKCNNITSTYIFGCRTLLPCKEVP
jgi:hypothetical protein